MGKGKFPQAPKTPATEPRKGCAPPYSYGDGHRWCPACGGTGVQYINPALPCPKCSEDAE